MSADLVERTRAVTTRLSERDPTKWKSARERLRTIWQLGFREGRTVGGPSENATRQSGSQLERTRWSQFARDLAKYGRRASERVEMSADRVERTRAVTTRLTKRNPTK